jgi:hypothetical protein
MDFEDCCNTLTETAKIVLDCTNMFKNEHMLAFFTKGFPGI